MRLDVHHSGTVQVDVEHHFPETPPVVDSEQAAQILALLTQLGANMTALSDAVDQVRDRVVAKDEAQEALIAQQAAIIAARDAALADALANDAADQATIDAANAQIAADQQTVADLQAALDAANADAAAAVDNLATIDAAPSEG